MKRYLNAQYPDPQDASAAPVDGPDIRFSAKLKRGTRGDPPGVTWIAMRALRGNDEEGCFIEDPTIADGVQEASKRWARVTVPNVAGLKWTFKVRRTKLGKAEKMIMVDGEYEMWNRWFIDVEADDAGLYTLFTRAFPTVKAAFADAYIELVENRVSVGDPLVPRTTANKAVANGRTQGSVYKIKLHHPEDSQGAPTFKVAIDGGAANCSNAAFAGNTLTVTFNEGVTLPDEGYIDTFIARVGGAKIIEFAKEGGVLDGVRGNQPIALAALGIVAARTSTRVITVTTNAAPMANNWNPAPPPGAWTTPRATTLANAILAGRVDIEMKFSIAVHGGTAGLQVGGQSAVATYVDSDATELAAVICHELAHVRNLVRQNRVQKYVLAQREYDSQTPPRAPAATNIANALWYDSAYGGSGTHCSHGAVRRASCITRSGETYVHDGTATQFCAMFHASTAAHRGDGVKFCPVCINQLRGC